MVADGVIAGWAAQIEEQAVKRTNITTSKAAFPPFFQLGFTNSTQRQIRLNNKRLKKHIAARFTIHFNCIFWSFYLPTGVQTSITLQMLDSPEELIPTRATLIQRLKNWQDQSSWQEFFETYWRLIYGVAIKRGLAKPEAQDVVQETMISVAKHMPGFKYNPAIGSFKNWLLNMTRWRIADQIRKRQSSARCQSLAACQEPNTETLPGDCEAGAETKHVMPELEKLWNDEWEKNLLEVAIAKARRRMDPRQYQIFDFSVNKAWKPERVAKAFEITISQVYVAKHRVAGMIKEEVERLQKEMI